MITIKKQLSDEGYHRFTIITNEGEFLITFERNLDLYWSYFPANRGEILTCDPEKEFNITKENFFLYNLIDELFFAIVSHNPFRNSDPNYNYLGETRLINGNKIEWHSDEFDYDEASFLTIEKQEDRFKITFNRSSKESYILTFIVRISLSGSRYGSYYIPFMTMYQKLKDYNESYHQIHMEELEYGKKLIK